MKKIKIELSKIEIKKENKIELSELEVLLIENTAIQIIYESSYYDEGRVIQHTYMDDSGKPCLEIFVFFEFRTTDKYGDCDSHRIKCKYFSESNKDVVKIECIDCKKFNYDTDIRKKK